MVAVTDGSGGERGKSKDGRRAIYISIKKDRRMEGRKEGEVKVVGVEAWGWARLPKEQ